MSDPQQRQHGFTLIELLVSMALLSILGLLVVRLFDTSLDLWKEGEETRDVLEQKAAVKSFLERDLSSIVGGEGRMLYADDRSGEMGFVRSLSSGEQQRALDDLRYRGHLDEGTLALITAGEEAYSKARREWEQQAQGGEEPEAFSWYDAIPSRGVAYVTYVVGPDPLAANGSLVALYRAVVPLGAGAPPRRAELLQSLAGGPATEEAGIFRKVAGSLLHVEWLFRSEWTRDWESAGVSFTEWSEALGSFWSDDNAKPSTAVRAPILGWDSTRGDQDARNDVYPEAVRLSISIVSEEERSRPWRLNDSLLATSGAADHRGAKPHDLVVGGATRALPTAATYAKIGSEWVAISAVRGRRLTIAARGARGTSAQEHAPGTPIWFGSELDLFVRVPAARGGMQR
ncbi:MAG: prepilin-type N-terminal cleavage/methylation domain-containing protein [Planctomycetes bacterium]|nr:prepilin-type N-terminal cleavage/methylation domain-containing protein [Planctomycetota bacterium]